MLRTIPLLSVLILAGHTSAQVGYEPNLGAPQGASAGFDWVISSLPLGFSFSFPGAAAPVTSVDVTANGRVLPGGTLATGDNGDFMVAASKLRTNPHPTIAPFWKDMNFTLPSAGDVYFNALPGRAVITWRDAIQFGGVDTFTVQCQLFDDGRVHFVYDDMVESTLAPAVVGLSPGNGAVDPGESDLSTLTLGPIATSGEPTVYEDFDVIADQNDSIDLQSFGIAFTPDGTGGWDVSGPEFAAIEEIGRPCPTSFQFVPLGGGQYQVQSCPGCFDPTVGSNLGLSDESRSGPLPLPFAFPFPGGTSTSMIEVTDNGRIVPYGAITTTHRLPTPFGFMNPAHPTVAPLWADFDPGAGGQVDWSTTSATATITWRDVVQRGETEPVTFQAVLFDSGVVRVNLLETHRYVEGAGTAIVGITSGSALPGPPEVDLTALPVTTGSTAFEWTDTTFATGESWVHQMRLTAISPPELGGNLEVQLEGIVPSSTAGAILIGFDNPAIDLSPVGGVGCTLYSDGGLVAAMASVAAPVAPVHSIPVGPNTPVGLQVFLQGVTLTPGFGALGINLSNGVRAVVGP